MRLYYKAKNYFRKNSELSIMAPRVSITAIVTSVVTLGK